MKLPTEPYLVQARRWPEAGRHILAQFDASSVVVYQAYRPSIGHYVARHQAFGGEFSFSRMSWIKTNFLWMIYRCRRRVKACTLSRMPSAHGAWAYPVREWPFIPAKHMILSSLTPSFFLLYFSPGTYM
jgi:hypothetical protein